MKASEKEEMMMDRNIFWQNTSVSKQDREKLHGHKSAVLWFTGLSGSGKSTIASKVEKALHEMGNATYLLDGDNIRHGLNKDLSFSADDRTENIRRIGEVSKLFTDAGMIVLSAFVSPYQSDRQKVRDLFEKNEFIEVYVKCSLEECERRDPKGLYKKARSGLIGDFTGIHAPYEEPADPEITLDTMILSLDECVEKIVRYVNEKYIQKK